MLIVSSRMKPHDTKILSAMISNCIEMTASISVNFTIGGSHDQADAEWIVIRTQLWGHNDTPFGRPAARQPSGQPPVGPPAGPPAARGLAALRAYFVCFSYHQLVMLFIIMICLTVGLASRFKGVFQGVSIEFRKDR
jgi:hypothetical protein